MGMVPMPYLLFTIKPSIMPELIGNLLYTGTMQGLSMYKMRGSDKIIVRKAGGPTKKQIKRSPKFDLTRRNNSEFGGRSRAAQKVKRILYPLQFIADYNFTGPLNALFKHIRHLDTEQKWGKKGILLSGQPDLLVGFNLNRKFLFDSIVRCPVGCTLSKKSLQASIHIPALVPGINFSPAGLHPWFRIIAVMGIVPDLVYTPQGYFPEGSREDYFPEYVQTDWLPTSTGSPAIDLALSIPDKPKIKGYSCLLAIGIAMGNMEYGQIRAVKYVGGAKVLAMA
jgi:hypothetical protein